MKQIILKSSMVVLAISLAAPAWADGGYKYGMAGCGVGTYVLKENTKSQQIALAVGPSATSLVLGALSVGVRYEPGTITSSIFTINTFAISSGTSNCEDPAGSKASIAKDFVVANRDSLEKDIARGSGETLVSFSEVMECQDVEKVGPALQKNYQKIYSDSKLEASQVSDEILNVLKQDHVCLQRGEV